VVTGFAVGAEDRPKVWDARTGERVIALEGPTSVVGFSADGRLLGAAGTSSFAIWSVGDWKLLHKFARDEPAITHGSLAFLRDGSEVAVTRTRQQAQLRATLSDESFANFVAPQPQSVSSLRMALDGSVLVTASATDKLQVWRLGPVHRHLSAMGLDWRDESRVAAVWESPTPAFITSMPVILLIDMAEKKSRGEKSPALIFSSN
jgi:WD40 repeat protein